MEPTEPTAGQTIAERYRLLALRGSGGMGNVWQALHIPDQRECALKLLHRAPAHQMPERIARFLREAKAASSIASPYAVRVLDYGLATETPFIAMELLEGETLDARLQRGPLAPAETSRVIEQVAGALDRAHELGIVHRDLKPANVFLAQDASGTVAKVLDFGIAKLRDDDTLAPDLTASGALLGTPYYMSPEQIEGARYVEHSSDLWSLGLIAFECLTGQRAFKAEGLRALFAAICVQPLPVPSRLALVPAGFDAWFARAAERDPGRRFRSAGELARSLRAACMDELALQDTVDDPRPAIAVRSQAPAPAAAAAERVRPGAARRGWLWPVAGLIAIAAAWFSVRWLAPDASAAAAASARASERAPARAPERMLAGSPDQPLPSAAAPAASPATPPAADPAAAARQREPPSAPVERAKPAKPRALLGDRAPAPARRNWDVESMLRDRK